MISRKYEKKSLQERLIETEQRANHWLAEANEASERGDKLLAEKLYLKSQTWLDRYNKLAGNW